MANDRSLYTWGFHLASRNCVILVLTFFADTEYIGNPRKLGDSARNLRSSIVFNCTQNPGFSAYTQHWVVYTWDELIMSISQVGKPLHEFEEDLSRSYLIWTLNLLKANLESILFPSRKTTCGSSPALYFSFSCLFRLTPLMTLLVKTIQIHYTQNPGSSAYTPHWVLYIAIT